jgi:pimeloyl-ACP methyl ester carboxylesterase
LIRDYVIYFAHGKESGPWGRKITQLAKIARKKGWHVESPDYSFTHNPDERVQFLLGLKPKAKKRLVLVGSSMGAYVSTVASAHLKVHGLFLLAPAFYIPRYKVQNPFPKAKHVEIIHGWDDELIPLDNSLGFAEAHKSVFHILKGDHSLTNVLPEIEKLFELFLDKIKGR